jgi:hypothetical protein
MLIVAKLKARREASRQNVPIFFFNFDAKLRVAFLASLCSAIFSGNNRDKELVTLPAGVILQKKN